MKGFLSSMAGLFGGSARLTLVINGQRVCFNSPTEFGYSCAGRVGLPPERIATVQAMSIDQLRDEHQDLGLLQARLAQIVADAAQNSEVLRERLDSIPLHSFTADHDWRGLFTALRKPGVATPYLQVAVGHYLQYLANRQQVFRMEARQGRGPGRQPVDIDRLSMRHGKGSPRRDYQRLPKGRSIVLGLAPGDSVEMILSRHKCQLRMDERLRFTHINEQSDEVDNKRVAIGRDKVNDVIIDPEWRDVSRLHLVVEDLGNGNVQLTDVSSHGTFLPVEFMQKIKYQDPQTMEDGPAEPDGAEHARPRRTH